MIPASTAIDIVAITIENILTLLNAEIIDLVIKSRICTGLSVVKQMKIIREQGKLICLEE